MVADTGIVASAHACPRRTGRRWVAVAAAAAALGMASGCGIKGPLYLPQRAPAATEPAAPPAQPDAAKPSGNANDISRRNESISHTPLTQ
ncbi:lipoprotein [Pigmentiphaga sp.]|uniref:LPS translocon maturation chaperone LptM n=1 Tax=Pigmentiphaga sp. TaxID=1977564 RepID=UPI0025F62D66|nr:lipoprotein [Pigmentiphaga sp.]MBX6317241.1 lipoprotein [Pigmentiphaga sp.]